MKGLLAQLCCCLAFLPVLGQQGNTGNKPAEKQGIHLALQASAADQAVLRRYPFGLRQPDSLSARQQVRELTSRLQQDGYLTASADSFFFRRDTLYVAFYLGQRFRWAYLRPANPADDVWAETGFKEKYYRQAFVNPVQFARLQQDILTWAENKGYPYARLQLDSVAITGSTIAGRFQLDKGPLVVFDSLQVVGSSRAGHQFLKRYLQIYPGQPYSQQLVDRADKLLRALPYVVLRQPTQVGFSLSRARVYLAIDEKKANQFDGMIGFLPNPRQQNKLLINGELNLAVHNIRGSGKQLGLQWRKVAQGSQVLDAHYGHPHILGSPLSLETHFHLYKQDSAFLNLRPRAQLSYYTGKGSKVSFFSEVRSSRLLLSAPGVLSRQDSLADVRYHAYGMGLQHKKLDDLYFPKSGYRTEVQLAAGNKTRLKHPAFEAAYYDTLDLKTTQWAGSWRGEYYLPLGSKGVLLTRLQGEALLSQQLFRNDLFRVGGLNSIRGFPDFAFYAAAYAVSTLEYRLYTEADSYVLLFYDQGYYRRNLKEDKIQQYPSGLGAGISFSTGAGIFQFIYAVGKSRELDQPLNLNFSRVHFGLVSRF